MLARRAGLCNADATMPRGCEICFSLSQATGALVTSRERALYRVLMPQRVLLLCSEHADEVIGVGVQDLDQLRARFREPFPGQRSLIPRRGFKPFARGATGRVRAQGRRASD
jgi:hypothetical protein